MTYIQIALLGVGVVIVLSSYYAEIMKGLSKLVPNVSDGTKKDDIEDEDEDTNKNGDNDMVDGNKRNFDEIFKGWEDFLKILEVNNLDNCAIKMKDLLVDISQEYRLDLEVEEKDVVDGGVPTK